MRDDLAREHAWQLITLLRQRLLALDHDCCCAADNEEDEPAADQKPPSYRLLGMLSFHASDRANRRNRPSRDVSLLAGVGQ